MVQPKRKPLVTGRYPLHGSIISGYILQHLITYAMIKVYTEIVELKRIFGLSFKKICGVEKMHGEELNQGHSACTIN